MASEKSGRNGPAVFLGCCIDTEPTRSFAKVRLALRKQTYPHNEQIEYSMAIWAPLDGSKIN